MNQIFVQYYILSEKSPILSLTKDGIAKNVGEKKKGDRVRGIVRTIQVLNNGKKETHDFLQIDKNQYINPKSVLLEAVSKAEGGTTSTTAPTRQIPPISIMLLPLAGLGAGLAFANHRIKKTNGSKTGNYIGWGVLTLFASSIPLAVWKYNLKSDLSKVSDDQKAKELTEKAYNDLKNLASKQDKKFNLTQDEFENQFSTLTNKEKETFIYISEETLKLDFVNKKKFDQQYAKLNDKALKQYGATIMESLSNKMGNF